MYLCRQKLISNVRPDSGKYIFLYVLCIGGNAVFYFEKVPNAADAKLDLKRGVVITTTTAVEPEGASSPFGAASFHENDYPLYYYNIKANAAKRVAAYKAK